MRARRYKPNAGAMQVERFRAPPSLGWCSCCGVYERDLVIVNPATSPDGFSWGWFGFCRGCVQRFAEAAGFDVEDGSDGA